MVDQQFEKADTVNAQALESWKLQYEIFAGRKRGRQSRLWQMRVQMCSTSRLKTMRKNDPKLCLRKQIRIWKRTWQSIAECTETEISTLVMAAAIKIIGENSSKVTDEQLYDEFLRKRVTKHDKKTKWCLVLQEIKGWRLLSMILKHAVDLLAASRITAELENPDLTRLERGKTCGGWACFPGKSEFYRRCSVIILTWNIWMKWWRNTKCMQSEHSQS